MYESKFQLRKRPFSTAPCVDDYFPADGFEKNRQTLVQAIQRSAGPVLIVGSAGRGKTMLCQQLATHFKTRKNVAQVSCCGNTTRRELLQVLSFALDRSFHGLEDGELQLNICEYLTSREVVARGTLLIIDDAHYLNTELLEEVQKISSLVRDGAWCVETALTGTPKLEEALSYPSLESFHQRIAARCYIEPFARDETFGHITQQIARAGGEVSETFTEDAVEKIHEITKGTPRLINQLCDQALAMAAAGGQIQLNARGIDEAWATLQSLPFEDQAADHGEVASDDDSTSSIGVVEFGVLGDVASDSTSFTDAPSADVPAANVEPAAEVNNSESTSDNDSCEAVFDSTPQPSENVSSDAEVTANVEQRLDTIETGVSEAVQKPAPSTDALEPVAHYQSPNGVNPFFDDFDEEELVDDALPAFRESLNGQEPSVVTSQGSALTQFASAKSDAAPPIDSDADDVAETSAGPEMIPEYAGSAWSDEPPENVASETAEAECDVAESETVCETDQVTTAAEADTSTEEARSRQLGSLFSKLPRN